MAGKSSNSLLKAGVIGSVVIALCCFTPILVVTLGIVGLGALTGYLDYVLFPALALFVGITIFALIRRPFVTSDKGYPPGRSSSN